MVGSRLSKVYLSVSPGLPEINSTMDRRAVLLAIPVLYDILLTAPGHKDGNGIFY